MMTEQFLNYYINVMVFVTLTEVQETCIGPFKM